MQDVTDAELLRRYVHQANDEAFAVLVTRHISTVYSAALRKTGNPAAAEEITQAVFVILAKKAARLRATTILSGWLYQTARLTAANFLRTEIRRARREQEAYMQSLLDRPEPEIWPQIMPLLEDAMGKLGEKDRNAIALRFFEGKSFQEIGTAFGASENAAKQRVAYALEKLRKYFSRHGVTSTTDTIAEAISARSIQPAPAALVGAATTLALAKGATASTSTLTLIKGALKLMAWTKAKTAVVVGVGILLATGTTTVAVKEIQAHRVPVWREKYDPSILAKVPPQVKILPTIPSRPGENWGGNDSGLIGLGTSVVDIFESAYDTSQARILAATLLPKGAYDFISTVSGDRKKALQQEITKQFGLAARHELIETNVLFLTLRNRNAPELKVSPASERRHSVNCNPYNGSYWCESKPMANLQGFLEDCLKTPVVDQTGLTNNFDMEFIGGSTLESMNRTLLNEVGLELVPGRAPIDFVVVEKAN